MVNEKYFSVNQNYLNLKSFGKAGSYYSRIKIKKMKSGDCYRFFLPIVIVFLCSAGCQTGNRKLTISIMEMQGKGPGWGHAIVIQTPGGKTYLYDTGANYPRGEFDAGKDMIAPFLEKNKISRIDGVLISHAHRDHFGGFEYLMKNYEIGQLWDNGYPYSSGDPEYDSIYKPEYIMKGGQYKTVKQGDILDWDKNIEVKVLSPPSVYLSDDPLRHTDPAVHHNPNQNSVVLRIKYKNSVFLFSGDLNMQGQEYLAQKTGNGELKCNVLCEGHGGAFRVLAEATRPEIVVESCLNGVDGPAIKAKEIYSAVGAEVYATCWNGTVQVISDGNTCTVVTERDSSLYEMVYDKELKLYMRVNE